MSDEMYRSGEIPLKGDVIMFADDNVLHEEAKHLWVVTSLCGDMVRAKNENAPVWRQAFYCKSMKLVKRKI